jgi:hypothetical protein
MTEILPFDNQLIHLSRKKIKGLRLRLCRDGVLRLSAPLRLPQGQIMAFLQQHRAWISAKQAALQAKQAQASARPALPEAAAKRWVLDEAKRLLPTLQANIGVKVQSLRVQTMQTRWGSCTPSKASIRLNSRLANYPPQCLEYVLVHELVHLLEASHNARFYALQSQFYPEWRAAKALLR